MSRIDEIIENRNNKWITIVKDYNNLGVPKQYKWYPNLLDCGHYVGVSDRSRAKTTNCLILALLFKKNFNYDSAYIRTSKEDIRTSKMELLFNVVNVNNYIKKIFPQYEKVIYKRMLHAFVMVDENGIESEPFLYVLSVDNYLTYTSTMNLPNCNFIIYDEFIGEYKPDTFMHFMSIHKTIIRERTEPYTVFIGNTIDRNSKWFDELGLRQYIPKMKRGENKLCVTKDGTIVRFELFGNLMETIYSELRSTVNKLFYGFDNNKMSVVTGNNYSWASGSYPMIKYYDDDIIINNSIKMKYNVQYYSLTIVKNKELGIHINIKPFNDVITDDMIVIVETTPTKINEIYMFEKVPFIRKLFKNKKVFYSDSYTGDDIKQMIKYSV